MIGKTIVILWSWGWKKNYIQRKVKQEHQRSWVPLSFICIYLILVVLDLPCCLGFSLFAVSRGYSPVTVWGFLVAVTSLVAEQSLGCKDSVVVAHGHSCSMARELFPDQGSKLCLLHWHVDSLPLNHQGNPSSTLLMYPLTSLLQCLLLEFCFVINNPLNYLNCYDRFFYSLQPNIILGKGFKEWTLGNSLVVQWLELHASTAGGMGSVPGWGAKSPQDTQCGKKKTRWIRIDSLRRDWLLPEEEWGWWVKWVKEIKKYKYPVYKKCKPCRCNIQYREYIPQILYLS